MLHILVFCHDYQNITGCTRQNCTFLHASREEEKLFRESGQFPTDLMKRHNKMNMPREDSYANQRPPPPSRQGPPPPPTHGPPAPPQQVAPPRPQQGPPMLMVNPAYQSPWFLLPPPPPPREPSPPPQPYPGPAASSTSSSTSYTARIDTSKPPPPIPQQIINGSIQRQTEEEGSHPKTTAQTYHQSSSQPTPEILPIEIVDTSKPPPRLPTVKNKNEKRPLSEPYAGPSKSRKIETESTTCENCLQWELRNMELEKKKKDKLKEKGILVLRYEEKKKEIADIVDTLKGLHNDTSNNESFDLSSMDLRYALNDPDNLLQRSVNLDGNVNLSSSPIPKSAASSSSKDGIRNGQGTSNGFTRAVGEASRSLPSTSSVTTQSQPTPLPPQFSVSTSGPPSGVVPAYSHPPPVPPQFAANHSYRPANNQNNAYFPGPGPSNGEFSTHANISAIPPTPAAPPYVQNMYYNMMGRPPPPFS